MNGILCIRKPADFTSFDVVAKMRGITRERKMGHAGTLDPMATGVLPLLLGRATKACDLFPDETKRYTAGFRFGMASDTQDSTGTILSEDETPVSREALEGALAGFVGTFDQLPPMYSAIRVGGQRLYDIARQGREIEREPRPVTIHRLTLLSYDPLSRSGELDVLCSKGTYVRTLIHDLGERLGTGGLLTSLVRTESSGFTLDQCITLEEAQALADRGEIEQKLIPVEAAFRSCPVIRLGEDQKRMFLNGVRLDLRRLQYRKSDSLQVVRGPENEFLGVARLDFETMELRLVAFF